MKSLHRAVAELKETKTELKNTQSTLGKMMETVAGLEDTKNEVAKMKAAVAEWENTEEGKMKAALQKFTPILSKISLLRNIATTPLEQRNLGIENPYNEIHLTYYISTGTGLRQVYFFNE